VIGELVFHPEERDMVREITMNLSYSMKDIAVMEFRNAKRTIDKFYRSPRSRTGPRRPEGRSLSLDL